MSTTYAYWESLDKKQQEQFVKNIPNNCGVLNAVLDRNHCEPEYIPMLYCDIWFPRFAKTGKFLIHTEENDIFNGRMVDEEEKCDIRWTGYWSEV